MKRTMSTLVIVAILSFVILSPVVASAATETGNTTLNATVNSTLTLSTSGTVGISLTPTSGAVASSASDTVTVSTNSSNGYALSLSDSDTVTTLANGPDTVAAHSGTYASPTTLGANTWGYRIVGQGGFTAAAYSAELDVASSTSTWAGVTSSAAPAVIKTTATNATNDATTVWYGVKMDTSKPTGVYTDTVTYTAVSNS